MLKAFANIRIVAASGLISLALLLVLASYNVALTRNGGQGIIALQLAFSKETAQAIFINWGPGKVELAKQLLITDCFFIPAYVVFLAGLILLLSFRANRPIRGADLILFFLPFIAGALDYLENTFHFILISRLPEISGSVAFLASVTATLKWLALAVSLLVILRGILWKKPP